MGTLRSPVVGTEIKVKVGLAVGNTDWKDLDPIEGHESPFKLEFYTGKGGTVVVEGNAPGDIDSNDNTFTAVVDSATTGSGVLMMKATIDVYDTSMLELETEDDEAYGYRREVAIYNTGIKIYE